MNYLHQDELNAIVVIEDGHKSLTVQLITYMKKSYPNYEGIMEQQRVNHTELSFTIQVRLNGGLLNNQFKAELQTAISKCQQALVEIQQNHQYIQGALKDYEFNKQAE